MRTPGAILALRAAVVCTALAAVCPAGAITTPTLEGRTKQPTLLGAAPTAPQPDDPVRAELQDRLIMMDLKITQENNLLLEDLKAMIIFETWLQLYGGVWTTPENLYSATSQGRLMEMLALLDELDLRMVDDMDALRMLMNWMRMYGQLWELQNRMYDSQRWSESLLVTEVADSQVMPLSIHLRNARILDAISYMPSSNEDGEDPNERKSSTDDLHDLIHILRILGIALSIAALFVVCGSGGRIAGAWLALLLCVLATGGFWLLELHLDRAKRDKELLACAPNAPKPKTITVEPFTLDPSAPLPFTHETRPPEAMTRPRASA